MRKKKIKVEPVQPAKEYALKKGRAFPDMKIGSRLRVWAYTKDNFPGVAWIFGQKVTMSELAEIGKWCTECSEFYSSSDSSDS